jgi:copper chaperone CopZ
MDSSAGRVFEVEQAGCESCAERVRNALAPLATVRAVEIDAEADLATVSVGPDAELSEEAVNRALSAASHGSGHAYRVKPGSWRPAG